MELNYLQAFYHVAKEGSFTEAARKLRISQPSLSKSVGLLEAREGVKFLVRTKKGVTLTEIGEKVFADCEKIFQSIEDIQNTCRGTKEKCEGLFRFGASDHIANYILPTVVMDLRDEHPLLVPSIFSGTPHDTIALLLRRELEFGLFFTKLPTQGVEFETIGKAEFAAVCSAKVFSKSETLNLIGSIRRDYVKHPAEALLKKVGKESEIIFESNSQEMQKRLCLEGAGYAVLARFMIADELKSKKLVEIPGYKAMSAEVLLATRKGHSLSLAARKLIDKLKGAF